MTIGGQYYSISLPLSGRRSDDPLDVCVVHLSEATVNGLLQRGYVFLDCPADVNPGASLRIRETVLLAGYPGSSTKYDIPRKKVIAKPFIFSTSYLPKGLSIAGFPPVSHIVCRYERRRVSILGKRHLQTGPLPHGMSGSGIWRVLEGAGNTLRPLLLGILTEYHANRSVIISTRIDVWIDIIRQKVDSAMPNPGLKIGIID